MTNQPIVQIKEKSVYGNTLLYPNNDTAALFTKLINKQTFSHKDLKAIAELGYKIEITYL
jgi:hypothetical protein